MDQYQSPDTSELAKALIEVQRNLQPAVKDAMNPFVHNRYATLNSVMESCRGALLSHDIWMTQFPVPAEPGYLGLVTKLTHAKSGQWQSSLAMVPLPKADPQGMGSAMTYARRYSLSAMLGIVTDADDDDGVGACATRLGGGQPKAGARHSVPSSPKPQTASNNGPSAPVSAPALASLPRINGITDQTVPADGGQTCIIATGNTAAKKALLSEAGFRWNPQRKVWWRYAHAS